MASGSPKLVAKLQKLCDEVERRLLQNEDYQIFTALKKTINEYEKIAGQHHVKAAKPRPQEARPRRVPTKGNHLSQREAIAKVLHESKHPMSIESLIPRIEKLGIKFKSKRPKASLSAQLSSNPAFQIVQYHGKRCWWFSERPVPSE
jgi:hypothetical protein